MSDAKTAPPGPVEVILDPGEYFYCSCGRSQNQPFCDGSHSGSGFKPLRFEVAERQSMLLCCCKETANPPFCDGSHYDLEA